MRVTQDVKWSVAAGALVLAALMMNCSWSARLLEPASAWAQDAVAPPTPAEEQPEALTRGPVHESFAQPVVTDTQDAMGTTTAPPPNIVETPPDERPVGGSVAWVPGYWAWDADRHGYIWVSGCWRVAPPGMSWVSGYWTNTTGQWQWIPGFWTPSANQAIEYLPAPPEIAEPAPSETVVADTIWVPSCYYWVDGRYVLRRGYWLQAQPGWVWMPSHFIRTPRGHIFVAGHWDYDLGHRGVLFAPEAFAPGVHFRAGFAFSPSITIDVSLMTGSLFVYPQYHHYYFGDYYDSGYARLGIYAWFDVDRHHQWSDPIFVHDRWQHGRSDPDWERHLRRDYDDRRAHVDMRPARTYTEMQQRVSHAPEQQRRTMEFARPLNTVVASKSAPVRFEHVTPETRATVARQASDANKFRDERIGWESIKGPQSPADRRAPVAPPDRKGGSMTPTDHGNTQPMPGQRAERTAPPVQKPDSASGKSDRVTVRSRPIADDQRDTPGTSPGRGAPKGSQTPSDSNRRGDSQRDVKPGDDRDRH